MSVYDFKVPGKTIKLPAPMKQHLDLDNLIIIRVYPADEVIDDYPQEKLNRNIYAYNLSGELIWQIQEAPHGGAGKDKAYMNIKLEGNKLIAANWIGVDYFVDLRTGIVSQAKKDVRPW